MKDGLVEIHLIKMKVRRYIDWALAGNEKVSVGPPHSRFKGDRVSPHMETRVDCSSATLKLEMPVLLETEMESQTTPCLQCSWKRVRTRLKVSGSYGPGRKGSGSQPASSIPGKAISSSPTAASHSLVHAHAPSYDALLDPFQASTLSQPFKVQLILASVTGIGLEYRIVTS